MKKKFHIQGKVNQVSESGDIINSYTGDVVVDKSNNNSISNKAGKEDNVSNSKQKNEWMRIYLTIFAIVLCGAIVFWVFAVIAYERFGFASIDPTNIILTAVGIAATFVVVSNYIQIKEIEDKFERKVKEVKAEHLKELNNLTKRNTNIDRVESSNELYFSINEGQFYFVLKDYTKSYYKYLSALSYLYELNKNDYFKYDTEMSELLDTLFVHKEKISISQSRKDSDINLIKHIKNNNGLIKYIDIIGDLP
jgi:hypothetical protein